MLTISIVMPAYNAAAFIDEAIRSVREQSLGDWELIIINDGSTDGTKAILDALTDPRVRVIHQANMGASAARNAGLDVAIGDYVTFLDADDYLPPDSLELRARFLLEHPEVDILNAGVAIMTPQREVECYRPSSVGGPLLPRLARLDEGVFFGPFYMMRQSCARGHRFPVGVSHCEDLIFFLTVAHEESLYYAGIEDCAYEYRRRLGSAMSDLDGVESGYIALLGHAKMLPKIPPDALRDMERRILRILTRSWIRRGRFFRALSAIRKVKRVAMVSSGSF